MRTGLYYPFCMKQQRNKFVIPVLYLKNLELKPNVLDAHKSCKVIISQHSLHSNYGKVARTYHYLCNL